MNPRPTDQSALQNQMFTHLSVVSAGTSISGVTYFTVSVKMSNGNEWTVDRRYSEFDELKTHLSNKGTEIPDFPVKHLFRSNTETVIKSRIEGFTSFLQTVVMGNTHRRSVLQFLNADPSLFVPRHSTPCVPEVRERAATNYEESDQAAWADEIEPLASTLSEQELGLNVLCPDCSLTELFEALDEDGSGVLEKPEMNIVHGSASQLAAFLERWDEDNNEVIDIHEFIRYFADLLDRKGPTAVCIMIKHWNKRAMDSRCLEQDIRDLASQVGPADE